MNIDTEQLERDLTCYFAKILGLDVDETIFRSTMPEGLDNCVSVQITGKRASNIIQYSTYFVQVLGKFTDRKPAWQMVETLVDKFPKYSVETTNHVLIYIRNENSDIAPFTNTEQGRVMQYASVNFQIAVILKNGGC